MISFAGGLPAPELFPLKEISEAAQRVLSKYGSNALQYTITEGLMPLREKIVQTLAPGSTRLTLNHLIITQGSQQGLELLGKLYLDKGSVVFTENPELPRRAPGLPALSGGDRADSDRRSGHPAVTAFAGH